MPDNGADVVPVTGSHTSTPQWKTFEVRMRRRRAERCLARADLALSAGIVDEARAAAEEARHLVPDLPGLREIESKLGLPPAADPQPAQPPARPSAPAPVSPAAARPAAPPAARPAVPPAARPAAPPAARPAAPRTSPVPQPPPHAAGNAASVRPAAPPGRPAHAAAAAPRHHEKPGSRGKIYVTAAAACVVAAVAASLNWPDRGTPAAPPAAVSHSTGETTGAGSRPETSATPDTPAGDPAAAPPAPAPALPMATTGLASPESTADARSPEPRTAEPPLTPRAAEATASPAPERSAAEARPAVPVPEPAPVAPDLAAAREDPAPPRAPALEASAPAAGALPEPSAPVAPAPAPVEAAAENRPRPAEPAGGGIDAQAAVRSTLTRYEAAFSALNVAAARAVWPSVDARALGRAFDGLASQRIALDRCDVSVAGSAARATCSGSAEWTPKVGGGQRRQNRRWSFELAQAGGGWQIVRAETR